MHALRLEDLGLLRLQQSPQQCKLNIITWKVHWVALTKWEPPTHCLPSRANKRLHGMRYLISEGLLLKPGLFLRPLKSQTQLLLGLCVPAKSCFFSLAGSAGIRLVKVCQLPETRDTEAGLQHLMLFEAKQWWLTCQCSFIPPVSLKLVNSEQKMLQFLHCSSNPETLELNTRVRALFSLNQFKSNNLSLTSTLQRLVGEVSFTVSCLVVSFE